MAPMYTIFEGGGGAENALLGLFFEKFACGSENLVQMGSL